MTGIAPMLCSLAEAPHSDAEHIIEPKFDGWRTLIQKLTTGETKAWSRTDSEIRTVPYITGALEGLPPGTILDGELVNLSGGDQWKRTQSLASRKNPHVPNAEDPPLVYRVFDCLEVNGQSQMHQPLRVRQQMLDLVLQIAAQDEGKMQNLPYTLTQLEGWAHGQLIERVPHMRSDDPKAEQWFEYWLEQGYEGIVCKNIESTYQPGARNGAWTKIKPEKEMDVEIIGIYPATVGSKLEGRAVGGIRFRATHDDGTVYEGRCAGMDNKMREQLYEDRTNDRAVALKPESGFLGAVAEVAYATIGDTGALRFPRFKRLRDPADKNATELAAQVAAQPETPAMQVLLARAIEWEGRAVAAERERDELKARLDTVVAASTNFDPTPSQVDAVRLAQLEGDLRASQAEVRRLENHLRELAEGKGSAVAEAATGSYTGVLRAPVAAKPKKAQSPFDSKPSSRPS